MLTNPRSRGIAADPIIPPCRRLVPAAYSDTDDEEESSAEEHQNQLEVKVTALGGTRLRITGVLT